ncbi:hypothetical protein GQX73_g10463 [Xylaria multiplex]|uniref:Uncharacterized protein n=1 Tax=Xylaria multiplex TaxID=323545 RepID=A0A7C8IGI9_9PEZI|nr:hypothetical protein GQX73_g10463 [Xylaria multiplex]
MAQHEPTHVSRFSMINWIKRIHVPRFPLNLKFHRHEEEAGAEDTKEQKLYKRWRDGIEAKFEMPEKRFPVIIGDGTILLSPEQLKTMLNLPSVPKITITKTGKFGYWDPDAEPPVREVTICDVSMEHILLIRDKWNSEDVVVWFNNKERFAMRVLSPKSEGVKGGRDDGVPKEGTSDTSTNANV